MGDRTVWPRELIGEIFEFGQVSLGQIDYAHENADGELLCELGREIAPAVCFEAFDQSSGQLLYIFGHARDRFGTEICI